MRWRLLSVGFLALGLILVCGHAWAQQLPESADWDAPAPPPGNQPRMEPEGPPPPAGQTVDPPSQANPRRERAKPGDPARRDEPGRQPRPQGPGGAPLGQPGPGPQWRAELRVPGPGGEAPGPVGGRDPRLPVLPPGAEQGPPHDRPGMGPSPYGLYQPVPPEFDPNVDPEMVKLEGINRALDERSHALGEQYRMAKEPDQRAAVREELIRVVNEHFEIRQKLRLIHLERMEAEIARLRGQIERRNEAKETIISRRVVRLTGEPDELEF